MMNIGGTSWESCRASCWWSRSTGTGTTGLINGTKAMQLEIAETSVGAVHKFPK